MNKKVLVIGGSGFIGRNIVERCIKLNWKVFATYYKKKVKNKKVKSFFLDLSNPIIPKKFDIDYDHIFFAAGNIDHDDQYSENVLNEHFYSILKLTSVLKTKNLYYFSTADEYKSSKQTLDEIKSNISIRTYYALAKHLASQYLLTLHRKNILNVMIFRVFIVYGPGQNTYRLIPKIITSLLKKKRFVILNSNLKKDFLFIDDFINAIFLLIKKKHLFGKVINLGAGKSVSLKYLGKTIEEFIQQGKIIFKNKYNVKSQSQFSSTNLIKRNIRWKPEVSLKEGLLKTIDDFRKN
mgnify:CR=1 FL=1|tara:strand:+ start:23939 stop:24820 length:882 start_codon:yes stop_codon:yes gene_type:complete